MLEIEQLEKEWRIYKLKRLKPYIFATLLIGGVAVSTVFWPELRSLAERSAASPQSDVAGKNVTVETKPAATVREKAPSKEIIRSVRNEPPATAEKAKPKKRDVAPPSLKEEPAAPAPKRSEEREIVLNPDTEFLNEFTRSVDREPEKVQPAKTVVRHETIPPVKKETRPSAKKSVPKLTQIDKEPMSEVVVETSKVEPKTASSLVIQTKQTNNTLDYLIERFNQNRDPKLATYIAQSFYKKGNYKETVRWSIVANSLDPSGEESWMLFAKAKVKLGQKEDAINALRIYLNQYSSKKVKSYLESLESGF